MDKLAQLKTAEVAGVISGLIDGGYLKLASDQEFEALTDVVAGSISDNWDLNEVLDKTAEVMDYVSQEPEAIEKTAHDLLAEYGYLCLAKEAGEISEEDFDKEAASTYKQLLADKITNFAGKGPIRTKLLEDLLSGAARVKKDGTKFLGQLAFKPARDHVKYLKRMDNTGMATPSLKDAKHLLPESLKAHGKLGLGVAGVYGAGKLSKKENRDAMKDKASQAYNATMKALKG